jgi:hypothetical protein
MSSSSLLRKSHIAGEHVVGGGCLDCSLGYWEQIIVKEMLTYGLFVYR